LAQLKPATSLFQAATLYSEEAKNLLFLDPGKKQIPHFVRNDNSFVRNDNSSALAELIASCQLLAADLLIAIS
jgi:hypothetical protein